MVNIKKLNKISPVIYDFLPKEKYNVSSHLEDSESDAFIVRSADCHGMEFTEDVLAIARAGAGTNNIPIDKCTDQGIVVFNTPGANANGVKELVLGCMIAASRNLPEAYDWVKTLSGQGDEVPKLVEKGKGQFVGGELKGKTLGVIGLGAIGIMVANAASAIGMNVIGYDPFLSVDKAWTISMYTHKAEKLDELLEKSDFITLHIPQNDKTKGFLSTPEFSKMKDGVLILNFARGGLVKTTSLFDAIESGKVKKYVTDFPDADTLCHPNVLAIPHLGASTPESEENCAVMAAQQLRDFIETGSIVNSVNMPECIIPPSDTVRLTILHKNSPNMVGQITNKIASYELNIADMANKSRGDIAYTVMNLDHEISADAIAELSQIEGVIKVRVL
ncbi:MAG: phosphoglycerate dehydrogenase [Christensenella hongkongensis]|uniref:phosphoglycerate dehydrogenase n=1 Tax=Christensenella hongkongensis TaxID=270498 RepID=UPI002A766201|nr:phosphoglycerate dehydrogenase [Christensenella hongkongensis]MDY3004566.1 phosphoglycerate dehydrogenase [Christensenella hongkongensis]